MLRKQRHQRALDYAKVRISEYKEKLIDVEDMIGELVHKGNNEWMPGDLPMYNMLIEVEALLLKLLRGKNHQVGFVEAANKQSDEDKRATAYHDAGAGHALVALLTPDADPDRDEQSDEDEAWSDFQSPNCIL